MGIFDSVFGEKKYTDLSPAEVQEKMNNLVIVDVRTPAEYNEGKLLNAINIDIYAPNFQQEVIKLDKDKEILVYCRSGARSSSAAKTLTNLGFTKVFNMIGGVSNWYRSGGELS